MLHAYTSIATGLGHADHLGQLGHICPGHPGLTHFMKYPGLTQIWHRITCIIIMTSCGDDVLNDVSISCQYILKIVIFDGMEAPRKVTVAL